MIQFWVKLTLVDVFELANPSKFEKINTTKVKKVKIIREKI